MNPRQAWLALSFILLVPLQAKAAIYKLAVPSPQGFQLYWWPVLPNIPGWHHDEDASRANAANVLVPDGQNFANAPAIMYGKADYKPRMPETKSIAQLIGNDRAEFTTDFPGVQIRELQPIRDADGQKMRCLSFSPQASGSWERVAYGQEHDDFLIFAVSATTRTDLNNAIPVFEELVSHYRE